MKREFRDINGQKKNVVIIDNIGTVEIYGIRQKDVHKKDGTWGKVWEGRTNKGFVTLSDSFYEACKSGKFPEDSKLYITLNYIGIQGTGSGAFDDI